MGDSKFMEEAHGLQVGNEICMMLSIRLPLRICVFFPPLMVSMLKKLSGLIAITCLAGCASFSHTNTPLRSDAERGSRATFQIEADRGNHNVLVILALSGGGSRAAYFSAATMLRLQEVFADEIDLLQEVDVISAVSGGSLPAAYYAISRDKYPRAKVSGETDFSKFKESIANLEYDSVTKILSLNGPITKPQRDTLLLAASNRQDQEKVCRLWQQYQVKSKRIWDSETTKAIMSQDYVGRWIGNWFWPSNIARYWFTAYDRSDIMAQTLADGLYDVQLTGKDLTFGDLSPERPYLILNATNGTEKVDRDEPAFGTVFTFTEDDFEKKVKSNIHNYSLARGVTASASFPVVFNFMTLRNYHDYSGKKRYLHVFDGGNADNLGLISAKRVILTNMLHDSERFKKIIVISVDAFTAPKGIDRNKYDARGFLSYIADFNLLDSIDTLLKGNRSNLLGEFESHHFNIDKDCKRGAENLPPEICQNKETLIRKMGELSHKLVFHHIEFAGTREQDKLQKIPTDFKISEEHMRLLDDAVQELVSPNNAALVNIKEILLSAPSHKNTEIQFYCVDSRR